MDDNQQTLKAEAERAGLDKLTAWHLAQFAKAKAAAERMVAAVPRDLPMQVEPAHTFRASQEA